MHRRTDYHYHLPPELIAQAPADRRDHSRLLVVDPDKPGLADCAFADIVDILPEDAVLVINDTRVFPARLHTIKPTGGAVELLFLEPVSGAGSAGTESWRCMARSSKALKPGTYLAVAAAPEHVVTVTSGRADDSTLMVEVPGSALELLEAFGEIPLPPYIARPADAADAERYQTVYARASGAVAAPTAGLHFTPEILARLRARGITIAPITLHVGMGTFAPVRVLDLDQHRMHTERYTIGADSAAAINTALDRGQPICAVGTTCVRALESAARREVAATPQSSRPHAVAATSKIMNFQQVNHYPEVAATPRGPFPEVAATPRGPFPEVAATPRVRVRSEVAATPRVASGSASTNLFIRPGFTFQVVDHLITNFHLPESTLLMLVAAFAGHDRTMNAYAHAVAAGYRFFSYGDAMLLRRPRP